MKMNKKIVSLVLVLTFIASLGVTKTARANDNLYTLCAHAYCGETFKAKGYNSFMGCKSRCTVKFYSRNPYGNKIKIKITLKDLDDCGLTEVRQTVKVKMKKTGYGKYKGTFNYDSGRASCSGKGTIWLDNGAVTIKLGLSNGGQPLFKKKRLLWS